MLPWKRPHPLVVLTCANHYGILLAARTLQNLSEGCSFQDLLSGGHSGGDYEECIVECHLLLKCIVECHSCWAFSVIDCCWRDWLRNSSTWTEAPLPGLSTCAHNIQLYHQITVTTDGAHNPIEVNTPGESDAPQQLLLQWISLRAAHFGGGACHQMPLGECEML